MASTIEIISIASNQTRSLLKSLGLRDGRILESGVTRASDDSDPQQSEAEVVGKLHILPTRLPAPLAAKRSSQRFFRCVTRIAASPVCSRSHRTNLSFGAAVYQIRSFCLPGKVHATRNGPEIMLMLIGALGHNHPLMRTNSHKQ